MSNRTRTGTVPANTAPAAFRTGSSLPAAPTRAASSGTAPTRRASSAFRAALAVAVAGTLCLAPVLPGCASPAETGTPANPAAQGTGKDIPAGQAAYEKSEVIYATLGGNGNVEQAYVINRFDVETGGSITDHGRYDAVSNLTGTSAIEHEGETLRFGAPEGVFYYQGDAGRIDLPWNVELTYKLDGRTVSPDELGGASGELEIGLATSRNDAVANAIFYDSFMLQITFTIPTQAARDIRAEGATVAAAGGNTAVAFAVLPGHDGNFTLKAQVEDFTMAGVQIAALPYSQAIEMPDASGMADGMHMLESAVDQLSNGAAKLAAGADSLAAGSSEFGSGLAQLAESGAQLVEASGKIAQALRAVSDALGSIDLGAQQIGALPGLLRSAADAIEQQAEASHAAYTAFARATGSLGASVDALRAGMTATEDEVAAAQAAAQGTEQQATVDSMAATYRNARSTIEAYDAAKPAFDQTLQVLRATGSDEALAAAKAQAASLRAAADALEAGGDDSVIAKAQAAIDAAAEFADQYAAFHEGVVQFATGVSTLSDNYGPLHAGTQDLAGGANALATGLSALSGEVGKIPEAMQEQIDSMMAGFDFPAFDPVSFMSAENEHVASVQFVMTTPAIKAPEPQDEPKAEEPEPTILDRVIALFG